MKSKYDVLVLGKYCMDFVFTGLPSMPILGEEIVADGFSVSLGGSCNAALAMHRLGLKVAWAAEFGSDIFSQIALDQIEKEGLDTTFFYVSKKPRKSITVALSFPQDRAFIAYYDPEPLPLSVVEKIIKIDPKFIYLNSFYTGVGLEIAKMVTKKPSVFMDLNSSGNTSLSTPSVKRILKRISIFSLNRKELISLTGKKDIKIGIRMLEQFCPLVVVKDGKNGAYALHEGIITYVPAIKVNLLDTTGAGDCFNAGFLKALLSGKPLQECLLWGNIVGGLSTERRGALERVITEEDIKKWLGKNTKRSVEWI